MALQLRYRLGTSRTSSEMHSWYFAEMGINGSKDKFMRRFNGDSTAQYLLIALPRNAVEVGTPAQDRLWRAVQDILRTARSKTYSSSLPHDEVAEQDSTEIQLVYFLRLAELLEVASRLVEGAADLLELVRAVLRQLEVALASAPATRTTCLHVFFSSFRFFLARTERLQDERVLDALTALIQEAAAGLSDLPLAAGILSCSLSILLTAGDHALPPQMTRFIGASLSLGLSSLRWAQLHCLPYGMLAVSDHNYLSAIDDLCIQSLQLFCRAIPLSLGLADIEEVLSIGKELHVHRVQSTFFVAAYLEILLTALLHFSSNSAVEDLKLRQPKLFALLADSYGDVVRLYGQRRPTAIIAHRCLLVIRSVLCVPYYSPAEIERMITQWAEGSSLASFIESNSLEDSQSTVSDALSAEEWHSRELARLLGLNLGGKGSLASLLSSSLIKFSSEDPVMEQCLLLIQSICSLSINVRLFLLDSDIPVLLRKYAASEEHHSTYLRCLNDICVDYLTNNGEW